MANSGQKGWATLEEYVIATGVPTGATKPNVASDPDYIAPITDHTSCPITPGQPGFGMNYALLNSTSFTATATRSSAIGAHVVNWEYQFTDEAGKNSGWVPGTPINLGEGATNGSTTQTTNKAIVSMQVRISSVIEQA